MQHNIQIMHPIKCTYRLPERGFQFNKELGAALPDRINRILKYKNIRVSATLPSPLCMTITAIQTWSWIVLIWAPHIQRQPAERHQLHRVFKCLIEALQSEYVIASSGSRMKTYTLSCSLMCGVNRMDAQPSVRRPSPEPLCHGVIILILLCWFITTLAVKLCI